MLLNNRKKRKSKEAPEESTEKGPPRAPPMGGKPPPLDEDGPPPPPGNLRPPPLAKRKDVPPPPPGKPPPASPKTQVARDGECYTREQFQEYYDQEDWEAMWDEAIAKRQERLEWTPRKASCDPVPTGPKPKASKPTGGNFLDQLKKLGGKKGGPQNALKKTGIRAKEAEDVANDLFDLASPTGNGRLGDNSGRGLFDKGQPRTKKEIEAENAKLRADKLAKGQILEKGSLVKIKYEELGPAYNGQNARVMKYEFTGKYDVRFNSGDHLELERQYLEKLPDAPVSPQLGETSGQELGGPDKGVDTPQVDVYRQQQALFLRRAIDRWDFVRKTQCHCKQFGKAAGKDETVPGSGCTRELLNEATRKFRYWCFLDPMSVQQGACKEEDVQWSVKGPWGYTPCEHDHGMVSLDDEAGRNCACSAAREDFTSAMQLLPQDMSNMHPKYMASEDGTRPATWSEFGATCSDHTTPDKIVYKDDGKNFMNNKKTANWCFVGYETSCPFRARMRQEEQRPRPGEAVPREMTLWVSFWPCRMADNSEEYKEEEEWLEAAQGMCFTVYICVIVLFSITLLVNFVRNGVLYHFIKNQCIDITELEKVHIGGEIDRPAGALGSDEELVEEGDSFDSEDEGFLAR